MTSAAGGDEGWFAATIDPAGAIESGDDGLVALLGPERSLLLGSPLRHRVAGRHAAEVQRLLDDGAGTALVAGRRVAAGSYLDDGDLVVGGDEALAIVVLEFLRAFVE